MKNQIYKKKIYAVFLITFLLGAIQHQLHATNVSDGSTTKISRQEFTKTIYKEFPISAAGTTNIINRYGRVDIKTYNGNQVKINITILVRASNQSEADATFDKIRVDFYNDPNYVKAETSIDSKSTGSIWNLVWSGGKSDYTINYDVYMPISNRLEVSNKYGDTYVGQVQNSVKAEIKYGNIRAEDITGDLECYLGYGSGTFGHISNCRAEVSYSKFNLREAKYADLTTKYSQFNIERATDIKVESKYDNYDIGTINSLKANAKYNHFMIQYANEVEVVTKYTDVEIRDLGNLGDFDMSYGGLTIDNLRKDFSELRISTDYTGVKVRPEPNSSYRFTVDAHYAGVNVPSDANMSYEKSEGSSKQVEGHVGNKNAKGLMKVRVNYGEFKIR